ncbi:MAG TPA: tetratricopeptide repeat protein [Gemmatimonadales bacterium]
MASSLQIRSGISRQLRTLVDSGRFREALSLYLETCETETPSPECRLLAGKAAARLGEFEVSGRLARSARDSFMSDCDPEGILDATNLLGVIALERGKVRDAEAHFAAMASLAETKGRPGFIARSAQNLGHIALLRGDVERARELYQQALAAFQSGGDGRGTAETEHYLAIVLHETGQTGPALAASERAIEAAEHRGEAGLLAMTLLGRAALLVAEGRFRDAEADIERAQLLSWAEGSRRHRLQAERLTALIELRRGEPGAAYRRAAMVQARATESQYAVLAADARSLAALALLADGRHTEAMAARDAATVALRTLGATGRLERFEREWAVPHRPL